MTTESCDAFIQSTAHGSIQSMPKIKQLLSLLFSLLKSPDNIISTSFLEIFDAIKHTHYYLNLFLTLLQVTTALGATHWNEVSRPSITSISCGVDVNRNVGAGILWTKNIVIKLFLQNNFITETIVKLIIERSSMPFISWHLIIYYNNSDSYNVYTFFCEFFWYSGLLAFYLLWRPYLRLHIIS